MRHLDFTFSCYQILRFVSVYHSLPKQKKLESQQPIPLKILLVLADLQQKKQDVEILFYLADLISCF